MEPQVLPELTVDVQAYQGGRSVISLDSEGRPSKIGTIIYKDYEDRSVRGAWFESDLDGKSHPLGAASNSFQLLSHYDTVQPLLELGYEPRLIQHARGGSSFMAFMTLDTQIPDPIAWDKFALENPGRPPLQLAVRIRSDLRKGHGTSLSLGYFRLVCMNGMVSKIMDLGSLRLNHIHYSIDVIKDFLGTNPISDPQSLPQGDVRVLPQVIRYLDTEAEQIPELPRLLQHPVKQLTDLSGVVKTQLKTELEMLHASQSTFSKFDLLNSITNLAHATRTTWSIYSDVDTLTGNLLDAVELAGVQTGFRTC